MASAELRETILNFLSLIELINACLVASIFTKISPTPFQV